MKNKFIKKYLLTALFICVGLASFSFYSGHANNRYVGAAATNLCPQTNEQFETASYKYYLCYTKPLTVISLNAIPKTAGAANVIVPFTLKVSKENSSTNAYNSPLCVGLNWDQSTRTVLSDMAGNTNIKTNGPCNAAEGLVLIPGDYTTNAEGKKGFILQGGNYKGFFYPNTQGGGSFDGIINAQIGNTFGIHVNISGTPKAAGVQSWLNSKGKIVKPSDEAANLQFVSPLQIYDKSTGAYYFTSDDNSLFSWTRGGQDFIDDGDTIYWPSGGVNNYVNSCTGAISVHTHSTSVYPTVSLVPVSYYGNQCQIGYSKNSINDFTPASNFYNSNSKTSSNTNPGKHFSSTSKYIFSTNTDSRGNPNVVDIDLGQSRTQMFYSMYYWVDSSEINVWGGSGINLTKLTNDSSTNPPGYPLASALISASNLGSGNWGIFTNTTKSAASCSPDLNTAFLAINLDSNNPAHDYSTNSSSVKGKFYFDRQLISNWNQGVMICLFGGKTTKQNVTTYHSPRGQFGSNDINGNNTFISNPENSTSATPVTPISNQNPVDTSSSGDSQTHPSCETNASPLTWIICPIFNGAADFSQWMLKNVIQDHLILHPVVTDATDPLYVTWQSFRNIGDAVLVISIIVIVYSEAVGGSIADAYNVRKMLPRLLIAAILVNLSVYIVNLLIDIFNILGLGISNLITAPFTNSLNNIFKVTPSGGQQLGALGVGVLGAFSGGGLTIGLFTTIFAATETGFIGALMGYLLLLIIPVLVGALAIFITVELRYGIITLALLISPVAFALYTLPNTEEYFKRWWKLLIQALMVFPVVMTIAAVADILSALTYNDQSVIGGLTGFLLQFAPLAAVPLAFRISGGILGQINSFLMKNGVKYASRLTKGARERRGAEVGNRINEGRIEARGKLNNAASATPTATTASGRTAQRGKRAFARFAQSRIGNGARLSARQSQWQAAMNKQMEEATSTGDDSYRRADTVNMAAANADWNKGRTVEGDYEYSLNRLVRRNTRTGVVEYSSAAGNSWHTESVVRSAQQTFRGNAAAHTANLKYEIGKATPAEDQQNVINRSTELLQSWGLSGGQATAVWKGATIPHADTKLEMKYYNPMTQQYDMRGFIDELYSKRNSYNISNLSPATAKLLRDQYASLDPSQQDHVKEVLETFRTSQANPNQQVNQSPTGSSTPFFSGSAETAKFLKELGTNAGIW